MVPLPGYRNRDEYRQVTGTTAVKFFFTNREVGPAQIEKLKLWLKKQSTDKPIVLVTHQVVITALTGIYPSSGDAVIFQLTDESDIEVLGSVAAD